MKSKYPDAEKVDFEKEIDGCLKDAIPFEDFERQFEEEESDERRL